MARGLAASPIPKPRGVARSASAGRSGAEQKTGPLAPVRSVRGTPQLPPRKESHPYRRAPDARSGLPGHVGSLSNQGGSYMSRSAVFRRHPKRTLTGLAAVLAAVAVAVGSGADFSASSSNTGNSVTAGTLSITNGTVGKVLDVSGLKPGGSSSSTVDIQNGGNISAGFSVYQSNLADTGNHDPTTFPVSGKANLVSTDCSS